MTIKRAGMLSLLSTTTDEHLKKIRTLLVEKSIEPIKAYNAYIERIPEAKREQAIQLVNDYLSIF
jgi:hypothetical protein